MMMMMMTLFLFFVFPAQAAQLTLPVADEFLKGSVMHKGGAPTGSLLYEGLVTRNEQGGYDGWLAKSWESLEDTRVWKFHLVEDAAWHDGTPFTSRDVKFTHDYLKEKQLWLASVLWMVETVECTDDHTVVFHLKRRFPKFLDHLSHCPGIAIIPEHVWKHVQDPMRYEDRQYVGTGPFRFVQRIPGQFFEMKAYEGYHGLKPAFSRIVLRQLTNADSRMLALRSGEIDALDDLAPWAANALAAQENIELAVFPRKRLHELCFNCTLDPTSSPILRKAIAYAIDREKICKVIFQGRASPATSWLMPGGASSCAREDLFDFTLDIERARRLLTEGGFRRKNDTLLDNQGEEIHLTFLLGGKGHPAVNDRMAEVLAGDIKALGIDVQFKRADRSVWFKEARNSHLFIMAMPDLMHDDSDDLAHFESRSFFGKPNWHGYSNQEYDRLAAELHEAVAPERRRAIASDMQEILAADVPAVAVCTSDAVLALRSDRIAVDRDLGTMYGQALDVRTLLSIMPTK